MARWVKTPPEMQETQEMQVWSLGWEDPLEEEMVTHSSILVWKGPWTEEPGGLESRGVQRVGHNWATKHAGGTCGSEKFSDLVKVTQVMSGIVGV